jgi:lysophospholipase L1-like esterase
MNRTVSLVFGLIAALSVTVSSPAVSAEAQTVVSKPTKRAFIVAAGDSIVLGHGAHKVEAWPARLEVACAKTCRVRNVAHGNSCITTEGCNYPTRLLDSFKAEVLDLHPDLALVGIGRNDLCRVNTKSLVGAYRALRSESLAAGVPVRFTTITPASAAWQWPCEEQRIEVNTWLRTLPGTIDFEERTITRHGLMRHAFDSGDGLHLNATGYDALGRMAARATARQVRTIQLSKARAGVGGRTREAASQR